MKKNMPNWLNNTLVVIISIISLGGVAQNLEWRSNKKKEKDVENHNGN
ncbi:hypothetical protein [Peribacillus asahii]|nr:hypothetical protein [Peribacillus asahii]